MYRPHTPDDSSHLHVKAEFRGKMLYAGNAAAGNGWRPDQNETRGWHLLSTESVNSSKQQLNLKYCFCRSIICIFQAWSVLSKTIRNTQNVHLSLTELDLRNSIRMIFAPFNQQTEGCQCNVGVCFLEHFLTFLLTGNQSLYWEPFKYMFVCHQLV